MSGCRTWDTGYCTLDTSGAAQVVHHLAGLEPPGSLTETSQLIGNASRLKSGHLALRYAALTLKLVRMCQMLSHQSSSTHQAGRPSQLLSLQVYFASYSWPVKGCLPAAVLAAVLTPQNIWHRPSTSRPRGQSMHVLHATKSRARQPISRTPKSLC